MGMSRPSYRQVVSPPRRGPAEGGQEPLNSLEPRDAREVEKPFQQIEGVRYFFLDGRKEPCPSRPG